MAEVKKYYLPPTSRVPNSPFPLLHYPNFFSSPASRAPVAVQDAFAANGWQVQWIFRYGPTQQSHYHSAAHECMAVLSGEATVRFGVADEEEPHAAAADADSGSSSSSSSSRGVEVRARAGDVFVLPAGLAHKTFDPDPADSSFKLLTPGDGHNGPGAGDGDAAGPDLASVEVSGFTMIGAYPVGAKWDFAVGGEHEGRYQEVWSVPRPERDPVLGAGPAGLTRLWG